MKNKLIIASFLIVGFVCGFATSSILDRRNAAIQSMYSNISRSSAEAIAAKIDEKNRKKLMMDVSKIDYQLAIDDLNIIYGTSWTPEELMRECSKGSIECNNHESFIAKEGVRMFFSESKEQGL